MKNFASWFGPYPSPVVGCFTYHALMFSWSKGTLLSSSFHSSPLCPPNSGSWGLRRPQGILGDAVQMAAAPMENLILAERSSICSHFLFLNPLPVNNSYVMLDLCQHNLDIIYASCLLSSLLTSCCDGTGTWAINFCWLSSPSFSFPLSSSDCNTLKTLMLFTVSFSALPESNLTRKQLRCVCEITETECIQQWEMNLRMHAHTCLNSFLLTISFGQLFASRWVQIE